MSSSGRSVAYMPPGDRKSGIPAATDIPAPVSTTTLRQLSEAMNSAREASSSSAAAVAILRRSQGGAGGLGRQTGGRCGSVGRAALANIAWAPPAPLPPCVARHRCASATPTAQVVVAIGRRTFEPRARKTRERPYCTALRVPPALPASSTPLQRRTGGVRLGQLRVHVPDQGAGLGRANALAQKCFPNQLSIRMLSIRGGASSDLLHRVSRLCSRRPGWPSTRRRP